MQSLRSRLFYRIVRYQMARLARRALTLENLRIEREKAARRFFSVPGRVEVTGVQVAGLTAEWLIPANVDGPASVMYIHGGAYNSCSSTTHRALAARMAVASKRPTLIFNYRLAPEHPFPAALEDASRVFMELSGANKDMQPAVVADSAGGGLALALSVHLKQSGAEVPAALALMSPWTDLAMTSETHQTKARFDPNFPTPERLHLAARQYAGGLPLNHPSVSPIYASLDGLPKTLIHVGEYETLLNDSVWLAERIKSHGGSSDIKIWPRMWHLWQMFAGFMPEADQSVKELGRFISSNLAK